MIMVSNLHKMHLTLGDDGHWVRVRTTLYPPIAHSEGSSIIDEASITTGLSKSHSILLKEMHKLHTHSMDKFTIQNEKIENLTIDLLAFKLYITRQLGSFYDRFLALETNVQEFTNILKQREEIDELKMVAC